MRTLSLALAFIISLPLNADRFGIDEYSGGGSSGGFVSFILFIGFVLLCFAGLGLGLYLIERLTERLKGGVGTFYLLLYGIPMVIILIVSLYSEYG